MVSEIRTRIDPTSIERGSRIRALGLKSRRVIWGAIKPIKPIVPPAHTAAEVPREPAIKTITLNLLTFIPRESAVVSPHVIRSR